jgi:WD40 repeat protein
MRRIDVGIGTVTHLAFSPDGTQLAAAGHQGVGLGPWPALAEGRGPFATTRTQDKMAQVAWHPDGHVFLAAGHLGILQVRDARFRLRKELAELAGHRGPIVAMTFSADGQHMAFGGGWWPEPSSAVVVESHTWRQVRLLSRHANQIGALAFTGPHVVASGSADRTVVFHSFAPESWDRAERKLVSPIQALAVRVDGTRLAVAAGNRIYLLRLAIDGQPVPGDEAVCVGHKDVVRAIQFSPDGRTLASVGVDGTLRYWDSDTAAGRGALDLAIDTLRAVAFAPDGLTVAAAGDAGTLVIVDVE